MKNTKALVALAMLLTLSAPALAEVKTEPVPPTPVAADLEQGKKLYQRYCTQCHGDEGQGNGPAADFVYPRPRDFTLALFKVRTTLSGQLPTDHDLFHIISEGLSGTSMPAWKKFIAENDRWQLVHYVKTFDSLGLFKEEPPQLRVALDSPPTVDDALIARGKALYEQKKCWQCHGKGGRGDGTSSAGMKDEWGFPIRPVNFTKSWRFRGGDRLEDIYRTFTTGFNGTPMPSFVDAIPAAADRWALAAFVKSLSRPQKNSQVLKARALAGEIPADPYASEWEAAAYTDFPLAGQIILEPRWFKPTHDALTARALYNDKEVAILLEWDDGTHDVGADGKPADAVALQIPVGETPGEKPYFILGDASHPVDYLRWDAAKGLQRQVAEGADKMTPRDVGGFVAQGGYKDGQYRVILRRPLKSGDDNEWQFAPGKFTPIGFHLWDGANGEEGRKMAISTWYYLLPEPATPLSVFVWPLVLGLGVGGGQFLLARRLRRRSGDAA